MIGGAVLNEWQSSEWEEVSWENRDSNYLIFHSLFIHPDYQGHGYRLRFMQFWEEYAKENRYDGIRLDAFLENKNALNFYERRRYIKRGGGFLCA